MAFESLADAPLLWGVLYGLAGVGIWVGGLLFFDRVWQHYRGDDAPESANGDNV